VCCVPPERNHMKALNVISPMQMDSRIPTVLSAKWGRSTLTAATRWQGMTETL